MKHMFINSKNTSNLLLLSLILLVIVGFVIRSYQIESHPPVDNDEFAIAYDAYSITQTGKDQWGVKMPLFFKSFGDYKNGFDIYITALMYKLFEPNIFWLRFPSIIFGTLYILLIFLLLSNITKDKKLIIIGTLLMTLSPYGIFFSRTSSASISQSFFTITSILTFIYYLKSNHKKLIPISVGSLLLSLYIYPSSLIVVPLLLSGYIFILLKKHEYTITILLVVAAFIVALPVINQYLGGGSMIRFQNVANIGMKLEINEFRHHSQNDFVSKIFQNKIVYQSFYLLKNFIYHFDLEPLIYLRNHVDQHDNGFPQVLIITFPFYILGFIVLFKQIKNPTYLIIALWIVISPLPSIIAGSGFNGKRSLTFLGSDIVLIILGLSYFHNIFQKKLVYFLYLICIIINSSIFVYWYFSPYKLLAESHLYFKTNKLYQIVKQNYSKFNTIVYTTKNLGEPQNPVLFACLFPPEKYIKIKVAKCSPWCRIQPFDKFIYMENIEDIIKYISLNIKDNKIIGFLSSDEIEIIKRKSCYEILSTFQPKKNYLNEKFYLIQFEQCI